MWRVCFSLYPGSTRVEDRTRGLTTDLVEMRPVFSKSFTPVDLFGVAGKVSRLDRNLSRTFMYSGKQVRLCKE